MRLQSSNGNPIVNSSLWGRKGSSCIYFPLKLAGTTFFFFFHSEIEKNGFWISTEHFHSCHFNCVKQCHSKTANDSKRSFYINSFDRGDFSAALASLGCGSNHPALITFLKYSILYYLSKSDIPLYVDTWLFSELWNIADGNSYKIEG